MRMTSFIGSLAWTALLAFLVAGCARHKGAGTTNVKVKEVIQVQAYTYLLVKKRSSEYWIATSSMEAIPGETFHYREGMLMKDFYSKELDRTFESVVFVDELTRGKPGEMHGTREHPEKQQQTGSSVPAERAEVTVQPAEGSVIIRDLYTDPAAFEGRVIRVTGEVTKFNPAIMERNWVHLQDGTEFEGRFDLVATSLEHFEVGEVVTIEGVVAVDLDFGYGYTYEILLEEATAVK